MKDKISGLRKELMFILLLGPNGSGKNLKGKVLCELTGELGVSRIVMSDVIDEHRRKQTGLGKVFEAEQAKQDAGRLLSDDSIIAALEQEIIAVAALGTNTVILDGFPRTVSQLKRLMSYHVPMWTFLLETDKTTALDRVAKRSKEEGGRNDDASAPGRFDELSFNVAEMARILKRGNPHSVIRVNTGLPVRDQVMRMLKPAFSKRDVRRIASYLDNPKHPARMMIDAAEKPAHNGGASAHVIQPLPGVGSQANQLEEHSSTFATNFAS